MSRTRLPPSSQNKKGKKEKEKVDNLHLRTGWLCCLSVGNTKTVGNAAVEQEPARERLAGREIDSLECMYNEQGA